MRKQRGLQPSLRTFGQSTRGDLDSDKTRSTDSYRRDSIRLVIREPENLFLMGALSEETLI